MPFLQIWFIATQIGEPFTDTLLLLLLQILVSSLNVQAMVFRGYIVHFIEVSSKGYYESEMASL